MPGLAPAQIVPTVGLNLARLEVPAARGGAETCVFWDLGGAPGLRGIWERYYAECDGVLFVVDAALSAENTAAENTDDGEDDRSKDAVTDEQLDEQMALLRRVLAEPRLAGAPALVLVNKADAVSTARAPSGGARVRRALEAAGTQRHRVEQTVGTVGRGVDRGVDWLVRHRALRARGAAARGGARGDDATRRATESFVGCIVRSAGLGHRSSRIVRRVVRTSLRSFFGGGARLVPCLPVARHDFQHRRAPRLCIPRAGHRERHARPAQTSTRCRRSGTCPDCP